MLSGLRYSVHFAALSALFAGTEIALERARGREDMMNAVTAGVSTSIVVAALSKSLLLPWSSLTIADKLPKTYSRHTFTVGIFGGVLIGVTQQVYTLATGSSIKYPSKSYPTWRETETGKYLIERFNSIIFTDPDD